MKIFVDANVLVSVLNKEYPVYPYAARVLSLHGNKRTSIVTSSICLAIAFYFAEKKHGYELAKSKIHLLVQNMEIADCGEREVRMSAANKKVNDFEDGLEYYAAVNSKCACIISADTDDFYFSEIEVLTAENYLIKHLKQQNKN
jgi:predicted nucleic acid-binding protein